MLDANHEWNVSVKPLIVGFLASLALTFTTYYIAIVHYFYGQFEQFVLMGLAMLQALFQLIFFLHLGIETQPRWKLMLFFLMLFIMVVIVVGSIWIMANLDYNLMPMDR